MSSLKVMCWNVENLFLPPPDDAASQDRFQRKLASLAVVIDGEQPDVLALQEIGPDGALQALLQALTHSMPHAFEGIPDGRGIRVAFLSKHPISRQHAIQPFPLLIRPVQAVDPVFYDPATEPDETPTRPWAAEHWKLRSICTDKRSP